MSPNLQEQDHVQTAHSSFQEAIAASIDICSRVFTYFKMFTDVNVMLRDFHMFLHDSMFCLYHFIRFYIYDVLTWGVSRPPPSPGKFVWTGGWSVCGADGRPLVCR